MNERVILSQRNGIAYVKLNRAEKFNGLDEAMINGLISTAGLLRRYKDVRAVILHAEGDNFCTGLDFASSAKNPLFIPRVFFNLPGALMNRVQKAAIAWRQLPMPVIAVVQGKCLGGGLQIALGADFRFVFPDSEFSVLEIKWGLVPDMGGTAVFREQLRMDEIKELAMTGDFISAERARQLGLVSRVCSDPMAEAVELAMRFKEKSPDALAMTKHLLHANSHGSLRSLLRRERWAQMRLFGRKNQKLAIANQKAQQLKPYSERVINRGIL